MVGGGGGGAPELTDFCEALESDISERRDVQELQTKSWLVEDCAVLT